jgi:hypothetical protein
MQLRDNQTVPEVSEIFSAGILYTGATTIGPTSIVTYFIISISLIAITIIHYSRKRKLFDLQYF